MKKKIFKSIFIVVVSTLFISLVLSFGVMYYYLNNIQENELKTKLAIVAQSVEKYGVDYLKNTEFNRGRITLVEPNGNVIFDNKAKVEHLDNHRDREEIQEAIEYGIGYSVRFSDTLMTETVYYSIELNTGNVLRISVEFYSLLNIVTSLVFQLLIVSAIALVLSSFIAKKLANKLVEPLNNLDLEHPMKNNTYAELSPLLNHINAQYIQISNNEKELNRRRNEFTATISNMTEGLVLLDKKKKIISANSAALFFFGLSEYNNIVGSEFLTVERERTIIKAIEESLDTKQEIEIERFGRIYQLNITCVKYNEEKIQGYIILILDQTLKVKAEKIRREFTANVSHELKTPLHSIMGSAELLENSLVKKEDIPRFIGHIRKESSRLVSIIDDIIKLSVLDEKSQYSFEAISLDDVVNSVVGSLEPISKTKKVTISHQLSQCTIPAIYSLLHDVVYNIIENAVKYNVEDGKVDITLVDLQDKAVLTVKDTGIGIPKQYHDRVFERFFRVDKSHSRTIGGTGLGLSIVKHAMMKLNGKVSYTSVENEGTTFVLEFKK
ncbi:MAG: ATP-binding protein [Ruminobacter sp.]|nr:ATP-binding protein [Ruminobacter sp.]